jgi:SM-20-related protein
MPAPDQTCFTPAALADEQALRDAFARDGLVRIAPFVAEEEARALEKHLLERDDWRLVLNAGEKVYEIDRSGQKAMDSEARGKLERLVAKAANSGFQYRFETIRVPDDPDARAACATPLDDFASFLSTPPMLDALRSITASPDIAFADAQATSYGPGHFLTAHNDDVTGKNRRAAYVYGLTEGWRPEWGGLLMFHGPDGGIERTLVPRHNVLTIFAVPQLHSVSYVTPSAGRPRLSITGWLRARG